MKGKCKLCQEELKGMTMGCSMGTICMKCCDNVQDAMMQPASNLNVIIWTLAEVYFKKGKGKVVSFKDIWKINSDLKLVKFEDLFRKKEAKE